MSNIFSDLIKLGVMKEGIPEVYAMELYAPFFMYHTVGMESEDIMKHLQEHVSSFRKTVAIE